MRKRVLKALIEVALLAVVIFSILLANHLIDRNKYSTYKVIPDSDKYAYQIEEIQFEGDCLVIKGWFFTLKKVKNSEQIINNSSQMGIVVSKMRSEEKTDFEQINTQKGIFAEVEIQNRPDINKYFYCDYDYTRCGFVSKVSDSKYDLKNGLYRIIIKPNINEDIGIQAAYLIDGKLVYFNPLDEKKLDVKGTDLEKIVTNGTCLVSDEENHIFIYQYGWNLYWIAEKGYSFENDKSTLIQYQLDTTQFDKLPSSRTDNGYYWSNLSTNFESDEATDTMNCGEYRVFVREIPREYSIVRIMTGYIKDDKWIWQHHFRPDYRLLKE